MKPDRAFAELEDLVKTSSDTEFAPQMKKQFAEKLEKAKEELTPALITDKWIYRYVVLFLGFTILGCLFFTFYLSVKHTGGSEIKIPDIFLAIGSAGIGALAGLLAPSPIRGSNE